MKHLLAILFFLICNSVYAQSINGIVSDESIAMEGVNVSILGSSSGTSTDLMGKYQLKVKANTTQKVAFSFIGFETQVVEIPMLKMGQEYELNVQLSSNQIRIDDVNIEDQQIRTSTFEKIDSKHVTVLPTSNSGVEDLIKTMPGVSSSNELSSQYNVRGGNYDENLVYVNGIEIYRPFLIRSGQQEGLSFVNSDLVSAIQFSAGGFAAKYGDKMSSVLDITYKKPIGFGGSATLSFLGANLHLEGSSPSKKFSYLIGARKKSTKHVLNSLDTQGEYTPDFTDVQTYVNYDFSDQLSIAYLGNYSNNRYQQIPQNRSTRFGTISVPLEVRIFFEGQEIDEYETFFNALSFNWQPNSNINLNLTGSAFTTYESETFDILGQYWLYEIENDLGSDDFGEATFNRGVGTHLNHARNYLQAEVFSIQHNGLFTKEDIEFRWGLRSQSEQIRDVLSEWILIDSAGFSLPHPADNLA